MPSAIARLRALVHGVLLCSLLTTWLGKPVDVVASLGTWLSCVCISNDGASCQSDRGGIRGARRIQCASCKFQSKVCEVESFESFVFAFSQFAKNQFWRSRFFRFFDSVIVGSPPGRAAVGSADRKIICGSRSDSCASCRNGSAHPCLLRQTFQAVIRCPLYLGGLL
jgi:hypothetical protein